MKEKNITIQRAKGRPMLSWVGKKPLTTITAYPAQLVESFSPAVPSGYTQEPDIWEKWPSQFRKTGLLFHGDNKDILAYLLVNGFRGQIDLIYIDPPFDSGADYVRKVHLRGLKDTSDFEEGNYSIGEQIQYTDIWVNDTYMQFIYDRVLLLKEVLSEDGFIVLHMNTNRVHYIKLILDEVFEQSNFRNEIVVKRIRKSYTVSSGIKSVNEGCDYLLVYSKSTNSKLSPPMKYDPKDVRWHAFDAPNIRPNLTYDLFGKMPPPGRCWMKSINEANLLISKGELRPNPSSGWPEYKIESSDFIVRDSLWDDITASAFTTGYPTEKKEEMIELVIKMCSKTNSIIMDGFLGSGTTAAVAQKLGRRWIGCDINKGAIQTTTKRLQGIIEEQIQDLKKSKKPLPGMDSIEETIPAQLSFDVYRVNDYDLQIQHNEAVNLACEHIGVTRTHTDSFFDGTLGKKLVRIIPFNHPLTPLDLEEVKRELDSRKEEDRDIVLVCLGKELAADAWLEDWNKLRSKTSVPNKIEVIELRTDAKYGGFMMHEPDEAEVKMERDGDEIKVKINNYISPTIIKRLKDQSGVLAPQIDDWRCMVDSVMIDANYDGKVFNITFTDVPEKKDDLVAGEYTFTADHNNQNVAVKITDMLGEEVLVTRFV